MLQSIAAYIRKGVPSGAEGDRMQRYAIYWAPRPDSPLAAFGREWLGADPETGEAPGRREMLGLDAGLVERATVTPRVYGLHATMKAPFRPAPGLDEAQLAEALAEFCAPRRRFAAGPLRLARFDRWIALIPTAPLADLNWLADQCIVHFDRFRAPLSEEDRARRGPVRDPLHALYLEQFGYPAIFSAFGFHITLAGPLPAQELDAVENALRPAVTRFTETPFTVEELCWFGDPGGGRLFKVCSRAALMR
jgi:hypothetical protein